uniref:sugar O-acetyltransferase n=1 Tax=Ningiella ruwaisensis TaxID=2364274 RepID=UPI0010A0517D|nr:sugar O-acetyltransferase [Ningiella ruwaisensis]
MNKQVNKQISELDKMLAQQWYFATDKTLVNMRSQAKRLCHVYNQSAPDDKQAKRSTLKLLLPHVKGGFIESNFYCDYGVHIYSPGPVFFNHNVSILDGAPVHLGKNLFVGPSTVIATTSHHMDADKRARGLCRSKPITIGDDVWIGANVTILGGIDIPSGSVIAAGTTVR